MTVSEGAYPLLPGLSLVFPAYNDGGTIASMVLTARAAAAQVTRDFEIIVVDDASRDYTPQVLEELLKVVPELRVITHAANRGYGGALADGFSAARKDWIFYTDGDAQYNPLELVYLNGARRAGTDLVNGFKIRRSDSLVRKISGFFYRRMARRVFGVRIRDINCDFRLFRRSLYAQSQITSTGGTFGLEMILQFQRAGARIVEIPVHHYARVYGRSQFFHLPQLVETLRQLYRLWRQDILGRRLAPGETETLPE